MRHSLIHSYIETVVTRVAVRKEFIDLAIVRVGPGLRGVNRPSVRECFAGWSQVGVMQIWSETSAEVHVLKTDGEVLREGLLYLQIGLNGIHGPEIRIDDLEVGLRHELRAYGIGYGGVFRCCGRCSGNGIGVIAVAVRGSLRSEEGQIWNIKKDASRTSHTGPI